MILDNYVNTGGASEKRIEWEVDEDGRDEYSSWAGILLSREESKILGKGENSPTVLEIIFVRHTYGTTLDKLA